MFSHIYLDSSTPDLSSHFTNPISVYSRSIPGFPCFPPSNHYLLIHQSSLAIYQVQFSSVQFTKLTPTYSLGFNLDAILSKTSSLTKSSNFPNLDCVLFVCFSSSLHNFVKLTACSCMLSFVQVIATPRTIACQAPLSMGCRRQENWSGLPFPPPRDLPNPGIEPGSPALQADSLPLESSGKPPNLLHDIINACLFDDISI